MSVLETKEKKDFNEDEIEIRLSDIIHFLKDSSRVIIRCSIVFFIIGIIYAFTQQNEFDSTVKVMPEFKASSGGGDLGGLKSLAGLAGISFENLGGYSEAVRPDLYPYIIQSIPFSLYILNQSVATTEDPKPQLLQTYLSKESNKGILNSIASILGNNEKKDTLLPKDANLSSALKLTRRQEALCKQINLRIGAEMDKKSGIITITSRMPDALVAAAVARQTLTYLTSYVTSYRTSKVRKQADFLSQQVNNARKRYEAAELQLSSFRDRNKGLYLNTAKIEEQRLQADYLLAQSVYNDLSKQLEQAKIKIEDESPVFQILEPAQVPLRKSGPKRLMIIIGFTVLGALLGLAFFSVRYFMKKKYSSIVK